MVEVSVYPILSDCPFHLNQAINRSIDRESNFLVQAVGGEPGKVVLMEDNDAGKRDLDKKTKQSTRFAVLVMRDEDKLEVFGLAEKSGSRSWTLHPEWKEQLHAAGLLR